MCAAYFASFNPAMLVELKEHQPHNSGLSLSFGRTPNAFELERSFSPVL